jgi:hypothetical protein
MPSCACTGAEVHAPTALSALCAAICVTTASVVIQRLLVCAADRQHAWCTAFIQWNRHPCCMCPQQPNVCSTSRISQACLRLFLTHDQHEGAAVQTAPPTASQADMHLVSQCYHCCAHAACQCRQLEGAHLQHRTPQYCSEVRL